MYIARGGRGEEARGATLQEKSHELSYSNSTYIYFATQSNSDDPIAHLSRRAKGIWDLGGGEDWNKVIKNERHINVKYMCVCFFFKIIIKR